MDAFLRGAQRSFREGVALALACIVQMLTASLFQRYLHNRRPAAEPASAGLDSAH